MVNDIIHKENIMKSPGGGHKAGLGVEVPRGHRNYVSLPLVVYPLCVKPCHHQYEKKIGSSIPDKKKKASLL